jgi:hypothetical protein
MRTKDTKPERRVLKLNRESVRLLSISVADLESVASGKAVTSGRTEFATCDDFRVDRE